MLAGWDLVRYLVAEHVGFGKDRAHRDLIRKVAAAQWEGDKRVKFSQSDVDRERVVDLFVDVTADRVHTAARTHLQGQALAALGGAADYLLRAPAPFTVVRGAPGQGKSTLSQYVCQAHRMSGAIYRWYAENGPKLLEPEVLDPQGADESLAQTEAIGSLIGVMPWNYPYYQVARFVAPNLMAGNTIVLKHAPICAASSQLMAEILHTAGVPEDAYINVFASNDQVADMIADPRVRGISLTGSERAGASVAETAGRNLKKVVLELGGSDALIVLDDGDVEKTAGIAAEARLSNAGQACNSPKRMIVPNDKFDAFVSTIVSAFENARVGDPTESSTQVGPLSSVEARDKVVAQVQRAVEQGATLHVGGHAVEGNGAFMQPAVLTGVTKNMDAYSEEIFGPVAVIYGVNSPDEAVRLANDVEFGLSGSVWSTDPARAQAVADQLEVGMAYVNEHGTTLPGLPFGGVKRSGFGRELGRWGMGEFVNTRLRRTSHTKK